MDPLPIWMRPDPSERRPAYTREQIVEAGLRIADEHGYEAVSMRRIAAELGAGTMTLYYYVPTKDDLVALMADTIMGELIVPEDELPDGWREGFAAIARRTRALFQRHRWLADHFDDPDEGPPGPNSLRHFDQSLAVAARTGLDPEEQLELVGFVDDYVFGYVIRNRENERLAGTGEDFEREMEAALPYLQAQLQTGEFPHMAAFVGDDPAATFRRMFELAAAIDRFERGLQRLLDGIEVELQRRRAG